MENFNIQSRSWKAENGDILRLESDSIELYLVRAIATITKTKVELHSYERHSNTYCFLSVIGLPTLESYLGEVQIPLERWADISRQIINGENWQLEGKI